MAAPIVTSINPQAGSVNGGSSVVIEGVNFNVAGIVVKFGDQFATSFTIDSPIQITAVSPLVQSPSEADVQVLAAAPNDQASPTPLSARFYYYNPIASPYYINKNVFFDPLASYVFYGQIVFVQTPLFASDPNGGPIPAAAWDITGNAPAVPAIFGTLNAQPISFRAANTEYMNFDVAPQRLDINADNFRVISGTLVSMEAPNVDIEATLGLSLGTTSTPEVVIGNNVNPGHIVSIQAPNVFLDFIPSAVTGDVVYIDTAPGPNLGKLSSGPAGGGGSGWNLTGTNTGAGLIFGTSSANGWSWRANSVNFATVNAAGLTTWTGGAQFNGTFGVNATSPTSIFAAGTLELKAGLPPDPGSVPPDSIKSVAAGLFAAAGVQGAILTALGGTAMLNATGGPAAVQAVGLITILSFNDNVVIQAPSGDVTIVGPEVNLTSLSALETPNILTYDNVTGRVTYGPAGQVVVQAFTTAGAHVYNRTFGMKYCTVRCQGAGGSGASPAFPATGSGGGAGGYSEGIFDATTIGVSQAISIGAGGAAITTAAGITGGNTTFGALLTGNGGAGGLVGGGGGGGGSGVGGYLQAPGTQGNPGFVIGAQYFAGMGGATSYAGTSFLTSNINNGGQFGEYGAGGGGSINVTGDVLSGVGGDGYVIITEYI